MHSPSQFRLVGLYPLVFDEAGSRVADTAAGAASRVRNLMKCIVNDGISR